MVWKLGKILLASGIAAAGLSVVTAFETLDQGVKGKDVTPLIYLTSGLSMLGVAAMSAGDYLTNRERLKGRLAVYTSNPLPENALPKLDRPYLN